MNNCLQRTVRMMARVIYTKCHLSCCPLLLDLLQETFKENNMWAIRRNLIAFYSMTNFFKKGIFTDHNVPLEWEDEKVRCQGHRSWEFSESDTADSFIYQWGVPRTHSQDPDVPIHWHSVVIPHWIGIIRNYDSRRLTSIWFLMACKALNSYIFTMFYLLHRHS